MHLEELRAMLTRPERREVIRSAREAIGNALQEKSPRKTRARRSVPSGEGRLAEPGGAFVTLRLGIELRGCIGYIESDLPLIEVVKEVAIKAAFEDPRFPPLSYPEFDRISLEVSILSPLRRIVDVAEILVGRDGLVLERGDRRGLLLPQVAVEYHWDREAFLENTSRKANLPLDAWKDPDTRVYAFSAEIVKEDEQE